jgi:hypothetical protein
MFNAGALTFQEFAMDEKLPLATIHDAILEFITNREDVVLFGAQAVNAFPQTNQIAGVHVVAPAELIASKVIAHYQRKGKPKSWIDRRDLAVLLLAFPELQSETGPVYESLQLAGANPEILELWRELVAQEIEAEDEDEGF